MPPTLTAMPIAARARASVAWTRVGDDGRNPAGLAPN
jgi:hypothetical protein